MDIYSLVATQIHTRPRPAPMNARVEDRYYAGEFDLPSLHSRLLRSIAAMATVVLFIGMSLI